MAPNTKSYLVKEYVKKLKWFYMPLLKFGACNRFDIKNGQITSISKISMIYSIIVILMVDIFGYIVLLETFVINNFLLWPEYVAVIMFIILNNAVVLNINYANRHSGAELVRKFIEIDSFLGIEETQFIRNISYKDFFIWGFFIAFYQVFLGAVLILSFNFPINVFIISAVFFCFLFCMAYDYIFQLVSFKFLCMRVHYLNISLVKTANLYKEYLIDQLLEYPFLWKKGYNDFVNSRSSADEKYFTESLNMIFDQLHLLTRCYRFLVFSCTTTLVIDTFLAVQVVIISIKDPDVTLTRTSALGAWFVVGWTIFTGITNQTDKFYVQIQRTKLICTYIQLKPNNTDEIYELTKNILEILGVNDHRYSIYSMFYFDRRLMISIATSVFIYITMQLQIAFPKRIGQNKGNATLDYFKNE